MAKRPFFLVPLLLSFLTVIPGWLHADAETAANIQTIILDDTGVFVPSAKLYIYSLDRQEFAEVREASATEIVELPAGRYRIYAGHTQHACGIFEHYKSSEATIRVAPGESASLILALRKVIETEIIVSDSVIEKIQLDPELSRHLN